MTNTKKAGCIFFALLIAGTVGAFAAGDSAGAIVEKANPGNRECAISVCPGGSAMLIAPCPRFNRPFHNPAFGRHHRMARMSGDFCGDPFARCGYYYHGRRPRGDCRIVSANWNMPEPPPQFVPDCEIRETKDAYVVMMEVPGIPKDSIKIDLKGNILTICGQKEKIKSEESDNFRTCERAYGAFKRSFSLPRGTNPDAIKAKCKDGVLTVTIAKSNENAPEGKSIKVE